MKHKGNSIKQIIALTLALIIFLATPTCNPCSEENPASPININSITPLPQNDF